MPKILLVIDVTDCDPIDTDPHEIGCDLVDTFEEESKYAARDDGYRVRFVSAEWESLVPSGVREAVWPILAPTSLGSKEAEGLTMRIGGAVASKLLEEIES